MNTTRLKKYFPLVIALLFVTGIVYAGVWNDPTSTAPNNNVDVPVHIGNDQVKQIGTTNATAGGLSVNSFISGGNALFDQQTFFQSPISGATAGGGNTVTFGGSTNTVNINATGSVSAAKYIKSTPVANPSGQYLCADTNGVVILCPTAGTTSGGSGGTTGGGGGGGPVSPVNQI